MVWIFPRPKIWVGLTVVNVCAIKNTVQPQTMQGNVAQIILLLYKGLFKNEQPCVIVRHHDLTPFWTKNDVIMAWPPRIVKLWEALYTRYPIVARRAWPAFRPSASREQRYLAYKGSTVYEKGPYEENIYEEHIFFVRPLLEHDGVREGALRRKYIRTYIFRKAPSRTWRCTRRGLTKKIYTNIYFS